jgi:hypothetical protein
MKILLQAFTALTHTLNKISTTVLLTLVFFLILTPVALIRRLTGADPLRLKQFKKGRGSVLVDRNHSWSQQDCKNLF